MLLPWRASERLGLQFRLEPGPCNVVPCTASRGARLKLRRSLRQVGTACFFATCKTRTLYVNAHLSWKGLVTKGRVNQ